MQAIADAAGVTKITVSRFFSAPGKVAPETAARIQAAIESTGYTPNRQAGQLAGGGSRLIAALIPNVGHSIFAETIQGMTEGLRDSGHELLLLVTGYSMEREEAQLKALVGWAPQALIVTGRQHTPAALRILREAHAAGTPVVEIWDHPDDASAEKDGFARIGFDHAAIGRAMARHLLEQGHLAMAYVDSGIAEDFRAHERGEGFVAEALAAKAKVKVIRADRGDAFDAGRKLLQALALSSRPRITAAAFANDQLACGTLMEAQAQGVAVPGRLALLGFGDFSIGRQLRPTLSTVRPPRIEIGHAAAVAVLESMAAGTDARSRSMPCELIVRGSTAFIGQPG